MPKDVYVRLREQLDQYSVGFPATESGVELEILEKLFTEEDAELFLRMTLRVETPGEIALRTGGDPDKAAAQLARMDERGTVFCYRKGDTVKYGAVPFVLGIYEFQQGRINREMAELYERYFEEAFFSKVGTSDQLLRPIPVGRSVSTALPVAPYSDVREIIKKQTRIAVAPCLCRIQAGLLGKGCGKPLEVCFAFGSGARHFMERGTGREVSVKEALMILDQAEEAGLVPQPTNSQDPDGMCNCCGDCCAGLRALRRLPKPAEAVLSNYFAVVDPELCTGCGTCLERCQMEAVTLNGDGVVVIDLDRCIGCGLCVTTCPGEALRMEVKPEDRYRHPYASARDMMMSISRKRGTSLIPLAMQK